MTLEQKIQSNMNETNESMEGKIRSDREVQTAAIDEVRVGERDEVTATEQARSSGRLRRFGRRVGRFFRRLFRRRQRPRNKEETVEKITVEGDENTNGTGTEENKVDGEGAANVVGVEIDARELSEVPESVENVSEEQLLGAEGGAEGRSEVSEKKKMSAEDLVKLLVRVNATDDFSEDGVGTEMPADPQTWDLVRLVADLRLMNGLLDAKTMDSVVLALMQKLQLGARLSQ